MKVTVAVRLHFQLVRRYYRNFMRIELNLIILARLLKTLLFILIVAISVQSRRHRYRRNRPTASSLTEDYYIEIAPRSVGIYFFNLSAA